MNENNVVLIITATANKENISELQGYLGGVMQIFGKNGGKPTSRFKTIENLSGNDSFEMMAIIEFPNAAAIKDMINGDEFQSLSEIRARVFSKLNMLIGGSM